MEREKIFRPFLMYSTLVFFPRLSEFRDSRFSQTSPFTLRFGVLSGVFRICDRTINLPLGQRYPRKYANFKNSFRWRVRQYSIFSARGSESIIRFGPIIPLMAHANLANLSPASEFFATCLNSQKRKREEKSGGDKIDKIDETFTKEVKKLKKKKSTAKQRVQLETETIRIKQFG